MSELEKDSDSATKYAKDNATGAVKNEEGMYLLLCREIIKVAFNISFLK
jgi:hypothetical protein